MELLEAINNILPYFGEAPITRVDSKHPTVSMIMGVMQQTRLNLLNKGWWFNTANTRLFPSSQDNMIVVPANSLNIIGTHGDEVQVRGKALYDLRTGSFLFKKPVDVRIVYDVDFQDLPRTAAYWIQCRTTISAYSRDYGYEQNMGQMQTRQNQAWGDLVSQHLRKCKYSTLRSKNASKYFNSLLG